MTYLDAVDKKTLRELLSKCWMTHDAMWFYHCLQATDIETTNKVNLAAVRAMAGIEVQRLRRLIGLAPDQSPKDLEELKSFFEKAMDVVMPAFMKFSCRFEDPDTVHVAWQPGECFAYKGIKGIGVIDRYVCGIFPRIEAWCDGLGLAYTVEPAVTGCMMHSHGECWRRYRVRFQGAEPPLRTG